MKFRNICIVCLLVVLHAFAASSVAEYCVEILSDSTYRSLLIKDLNEPIKEWKYPKTIPCEYTPCRARWETESKLYFPNDVRCQNGWPVDGFCGRGGSITSCIDCPHRPIELARVNSVKLYGSKMSGPYSCMGDQWYLRNARETLKTFYGKTFRGEWTGTWNTNNNEELPQMKVDFSARLVGECSDTIPALDYCVAGGKNAELYLLNRYDNLPEPRFVEKKDKMECEGTMRVEKSYEMDFGKYGTRMLSHFVEEDTCHATSKIAAEVYMPIPKYIDAVALKGIPARSLYGKTIPVVSKNSLNCNFDTVERNVRFSVRVVGKCSKRDMQGKKKLNILELEQVKDVEAYGRSIVESWDDCGEGYSCPTSCIEVKDLLK